MAILGIDVGGTFTDAVLLRDGELVTAKVPTAAGAGGLRRRRRRRRSGPSEVERFSHGTTIATNALARAEGRPDGVRRHRGLRAPAPPPPADAGAPLPALRRAAGAARPARALPRRARADRPGGRARAARPVDAVRTSATRRRSRSACCSRSATRRTSRRWPRSCGGGYPGVHVVASHEVAPEFREYERASTTAADAYLGPVCARYFRSLASRLPRGGAARAARDALLRRRGDDRRGGRARGARARLGAGGRRRRGGAGRRAGRCRERDLVRHGRDLDGRLPDLGRPRGADARTVGRRPADQAADGRHPHRRRGRRLDRLARRGRRRPCRPRERRRDAGSGLLRPRRRAPDGHGRQPPARAAAGAARGRRRARPGSRGAGARRASTRRTWSRS